MLTVPKQNTQTPKKKSTKPIEQNNVIKQPSTKSNNSGKTESKSKTKFEVINDRGVPVMYTEEIPCIPDHTTLSHMNKAGYTFKYNGKTITLKKAKELVNN